MSSSQALMGTGSRVRMSPSPPLSHVTPGRITIGRASRIIAERPLRSAMLWLAGALALGAFGGAPAAGILLLVAASVLAGPIVWRRRRAINQRLPMAGGLLLLFVSYTRLSDVGIAQHGLPSITQPLVLVLATATLVRRTHSGGSWGLHAHRGLWAALGLYAAVLWASAIWAPNPASSVAAATELVKDLLIVYVMVETFDTPQRLRLAIWVIIIAGALLAGLSVLQAATHTYGNTYGGLAQAPVREITIKSNSERSAGPIGDPNFYGLILVALVPLALVRARDEHGAFLRAVAVVSALLLTAGLVLTYSRGDAVVLAVVAMLYVPLARVRRSYVIATLVALAPLASLAPQSFWDRIGSLGTAAPTSARADAALQDRAGSLAVAVAMFDDHPLTGVGAENFPDTYVPYALRLNVPSAASHAHDLYLQIASETGLPGLVTFGAAMFLALRAPWRRRSAALTAGDRVVDGLATSCLLALAAYLIGCIFLPSAYPRYLWVLVGLSMAAALVDRGEDERRFATSPTLTASLTMGTATGRPL
jgi:putative inorganic carbon (HCO3(-)) transporter